MKHRLIGKCHTRKDLDTCVVGHLSRVAIFKSLQEDRQSCSLFTLHLVRNDNSLSSVFKFRPGLQLCISVRFKVGGYSSYFWSGSKRTNALDIFLI